MTYFTFHLRAEVSQDQLGWLGRRELGWMAELGHPGQRFTAYGRLRFCLLGRQWALQNIR